MTRRMAYVNLNPVCASQANLTRSAIIFRQEPFRPHSIVAKVTPPAAAVCAPWVEVLIDRREPANYGYIYPVICNIPV